MVAAAVAAGETGSTPSFTSVVPEATRTEPDGRFGSIFAEAVVPHHRRVCSLGNLSPTCSDSHPGFTGPLESTEEKH